MGRLAGFKYSEIVERLRKFGYVFDRHGPGIHELWRHIDSGRKVTIPRHSKDMPEGTLRAVLREAGVDVDEFLQMK